MPAGCFGWRQDIKAGVLARSVGPTGNQATFVIPQAGKLSRARVEAFGQAEKHSRRVRRLKIILPLAAVAMIVGFAGYAYVSTPANVAANVSVSSSISEGKLVMANPKLEGFTKDGRPYSMTAARAVQAFDQQGVINLEGIEGKMPVEGENWATVVAASGLYDRGANTLKLDSDITVTTTSGMVGKFHSAFLDIDKGTMETIEPVDIQSSGSNILADSMSLLDNGKLIVFDRRVRMTINPKQAQKTASGETDASN